jgi:hypothetical protein
MQASEYAGNAVLVCGSTVRRWAADFVNADECDNDDEMRRCVGPCTC